MIDKSSRFPAAGALDVKQALEEALKGTALGLLSAVGLIVAVIVQPVAGAGAQYQAIATSLGWRQEHV
jgi:hypothetical protein